MNHQQGTGVSPSPSPEAFINIKCHPFSIVTLWQRGALGKLLLLKIPKSQSCLELPECAVPPKHNCPRASPSFQQLQVDGDGGTICSGCSSQDCSGSTVLPRNSLSSDISELPLKLQVPGEHRCPVTSSRAVSCWAAPTPNISLSNLHILKIKSFIDNMNV